MPPIWVLVTIHKYVYLSRNRANIPKRAAIDVVASFSADNSTTRAHGCSGSRRRQPWPIHCLVGNGSWLSLIVAYVRHTFTDYDELLAEGYDADSARHFVAAGMDKILQAWGRASSPDSPGLTTPVRWE